MYSTTLSLTSVLDGLSGQRHTAAALTPGKTRYPLHSTLGKPQGGCGREWKILNSPGFDLQNVQPVARRYTD
jgi:hypothetical protein